MDIGKFSALQGRKYVLRYKRLQKSSTPMEKPLNFIPRGAAKRCESFVEEDGHGLQVCEGIQRPS